MAENIINASVQFTHDTQAAFKAVGNRIPRAGQACFETDTNKMKIGNGVATWNALKYFGGGETAHYEVTATAEQTDTEALATITDELHDGDTAVVKRLISGEKYSYTAFVYDINNDVGAWHAMDGNYSADNVYFDKDITYTAKLGVWDVPSSGSGNIPAVGKSVSDVLRAIAAKEANPTITQPSAAFSATSGLGTTHEVGTIKDLTYTAKLNPGSYSYGPATNVTASTYSVTCNGETKETASGTFEDVVAEETPKTISATITYGNGAIPKTNLGNNYAAGQIKAGSKSVTSGQYKGVRFMFWGPTTTALSTITSANVRALAHNKATSTGVLGNFGAGAGAKQVIVAVPSGRKIRKVLLASSMNADITSQFVEQTNKVAVNGANSYATADYTVYVYQPASIGSDEIYSITIA